MSRIEFFPILGGPVVALALSFHRFLRSKTVVISDDNLRPQHVSHSCAEE